MSENILIVDDEKEIADLIEVYLKNDGYTVYKFYNGIDALKCIGETELDLAIIDVMLPDIDGFHICQKIREKFYYPIIILTAKVEDGDKIMGLTIGADDYITKPFNPLEVVARVKTQLRRYVRYNKDRTMKKSKIVLSVVIAVIIAAVIWRVFFLMTHFAFFDYEEPAVFFLLDYLAIAIAFVFIGSRIVGWTVYPMPEKKAKK